MNKHLTVTLFSVALLALGCKPSSEKPASGSGVQSAAEKVEIKTKDAAQAEKDLAQAKKNYAYAQKDEFVKEKETDLSEINRGIDVLSARVETLSDAKKADAAPRLQALRDQSAKLKAQLDEAKTATESTWDHVKAGASKAGEELKDGFQRARQWASDKIAP
jgi:chromosome segregation ATPase